MNREQADELHEPSYIEGSRMGWLHILSVALRELGQEERDKYGWIREREAAVAALRRVCRTHGDNDWPENLHLADVIEKHLERHL